MASDLLSVGRQSVLTAQKQLNTTGHNISNANTEGYSRQSVVQGTNDTRFLGGQSYGMGVHVENVRRSWDQFAVNELNVSTTNSSNKSDMQQDLSLLSEMLSSAASKKIPENMNDWFNSLKTLASSPNDIGARKVVIDKADLITKTLNGFHETIRLQSDVVNKKLDVGVERINQIATELEGIHKLIIRTPGSHNDLMDKHDKLVTELSQYTKVTVTPRENGEAFNVFIGNGHALVSGTHASKLTMVTGEPDVHQRRLALVESTGIKPIQSKDIDGKLGAMLMMRDENIPYLQDELGRMTVSFADQINQLQSQGLDRYGDVGKNLFTDINSNEMVHNRVICQSNSKADIEVHLNDMSQLKGGEYALRYDGNKYTVQKPDGKVVPIQLDYFASSFDLDGMNIKINQAPTSGEKVLIRPTRNAAAQVEMINHDPNTIAAQSYEASTTYAKGSAEFGILKVGELKEFEVIVSPDGDKFAVIDTQGNMLREPHDYPPKKPVTVQGTTFQLSDGALANDKFTANLVPSEGDNGNLLKMESIQTAKLMNGNQSTLIDLYQNLNTDVGVKASTAIRLNEVATLEKQTAQERLASISGVNLDEEAANMMRFQQAYMASSRIMQTANDTFNSILQLR